MNKISFELNFSFGGQTKVKCMGQCPFSLFKRTKREKRTKLNRILHTHFGFGFGLGLGFG